MALMAFQFENADADLGDGWIAAPACLFRT